MQQSPRLYDGGLCAHKKPRAVPATNYLMTTPQGSMPTQIPPKLRLHGMAAGVLACTGSALLAQAGDVVRQVFDVSFAQGLRHAGHVAGIVGAGTRLEVFQLLDDIVVLLSGDTRNLVLA